MKDINNPKWLHNNTGLFTYDGRLDLWIKESYGSSIRSPFTDLKVFRSARPWLEYCRRHDQLIDKSILPMSFPNMLPPELKTRKGKIRYEGVWTRAYHTHGDYIAGLIDNCAEIFELMGILPAKLVGRIMDLQNYKSNDERHVIAALGIAYWLNLRNLKNATDINWVE